MPERTTEWTNKVIDEQKHERLGEWMNALRINEIDPSPVRRRGGHERVPEPDLVLAVHRNMGRCDSNNSGELV